MPGAAHFVTYRLADTLPIEVLDRIRVERNARLRQPTTPGEPLWKKKARAHKQFFADYDQYLDQQSSIRWLDDVAIAEIIIENLYHHHQIKYKLLEFAVMPNHVHVLFVPNITDAGRIGHVADAASVREADLEYFSDETVDTLSPLTEIMHSLKSYTANEANIVLRRDGRFWQRESYDHWVRDDVELARIAEYIANNPVSANLAKNACEWPYSSAYDRKHPRAKRLADWW